MTPAPITDLAVVPVAGRGTRLLPATKSQPKEMLPVGRKPVVQYVIEELATCGIRRVLFVTGQGKTAIENHFDLDESLAALVAEGGRSDLADDLDFEKLAVEYCYTRQRQQLGLGDAVLCARPVVGQQPFVVALGDSILGIEGRSTVVQRMLREFRQTGVDAVIAFEQVPRQEVVHYGIAAPQGAAGECFELADLVEKPAVNEAPSDLAVAARYVFSPVIFDLLARTAPGKGGEIQLTDAVRLGLREGRRVLGLRVGRAERRFDIGNFGSYYRAFVEFALADAAYGAELRRHMRGLLDRSEEPPQ